MNYNNKTKEELITEITLIQNKDNELQQIKERYQFLIENMGEGLGIVDANEFFTFVNPGAEEIFGVPAGGLIGHNLNEFVTPEAFSRLLQQTDLRRLGRKSRYEFELQRPDGEKRFIRVTATPLFDNDHVFTGTLGIFFDDTELRRAEDTIKDNETRLRTITDSAQDAILMMDSMGMVSFWNPAAETILGYRAEEAIGKDLHNLLVPERYLKAYRTAFSEFQHTGKGNAIGKTLELEARRKDGREIIVALSLSAVSFKNTWHAVGILRDITDHKNTEVILRNALEKAETVNRLKSAFIYNISHEVRTPLNGILGFSNLIIQPDLGPEEKENFHTLLKVSSTRLLKTITNYMDISMITSGNIEINPNPIDLPLFLNTIYQEYKPQCVSTNLCLQLELDKGCKDVIFDSDSELLRKIISHLLDNAMKFTSEGRISFGCIVKPEILEFFVRDTGTGISKEAQERIFDTFVQEEISLTRGYEGSGLGLSIARGLIRLLGGDINVVSEKGKGAFFSFTLPFEQNAARIPDTMVVEPDVIPIQTPVILIAEDDEANLMYLKAVLRKTKITVIPAFNGKTAIEQCRDHPEISLVLMDLKMPVIDGFEATREIKLFRKELPVIAVTAFAMSGDKKQALEAGCDDYIAKPVTRELLLEKLKRYGVI